MVNELKAKHRGGGSYSVMDEDHEVSEGLSKAEAEAFNAMSMDDQLVWLSRRNGPPVAPDAQPNPNPGDPNASPYPSSRPVLEPGETSAHPNDERTPPADEKPAALPKGQRIVSVMGKHSARWQVRDAEDHVLHDCDSEVEALEAAAGKRRAKK